VTDNDRLPPDAVPSGSSPEPSPTDGDGHGSSAVRFCVSCGRDVIPVGKGACPQCHKFLPANSFPRKHPVNVARRTAILQELNRDFPPATNVVQRAARQQLASALERLEVTKPGTPEWQRLSAVVKDLAAQLYEQRPAPEVPDYTSMSLDELQSQLDHLQGMLASLRAVADRTTDLEIEPSPISSPIVTNVAANEPSPAPSPPAAPIERCAYCLRSLADCADLRATDRDKFEALHVGSPEDAEKRRREETAVMLRRAGTLPSWY
jgi:hypothetical protein